MDESPHDTTNPDEPSGLPAALRLTPDLSINGLTAETYDTVIRNLFPYIRQAALRACTDEEGIPVIGDELDNQRIGSLSSFAAFTSLDEEGYAELSEKLIDDDDALQRPETIMMFAEELKRIHRTLNKISPADLDRIEKLKAAARRIVPTVIESLAVRGECDYVSSKTPLFWTYNPFNNPDQLHFILATAYEVAVQNNDIGLLNSLNDALHNMGLPPVVHGCLIAAALQSQVGLDDAEIAAYFPSFIEACTGDAPSAVAALALGELGSRAVPCIEEALQKVAHKLDTYRGEQLPALNGLSKVLPALSLRSCSRSNDTGRDYEFPLETTRVIEAVASTHEEFFNECMRRLRAADINSEVVALFEEAYATTAVERVKEGDEHVYKVKQGVTSDRDLYQTSEQKQAWSDILKVFRDFNEEIIMPGVQLQQVYTCLLKSLERLKLPASEDTVTDIKPLFNEEDEIQSESDGGSPVPVCAAFIAARSPAGIEYILDELLPDDSTPEAARKLALLAIGQIIDGTLDAEREEYIKGALLQILLERAEHGAADESDTYKPVDDLYSYSALAMGQLIERENNGDTALFLLARLESLLKKAHTATSQEPLKKDGADRRPFLSVPLIVDEDDEFDDHGLAFLTKSPFLDFSHEADLAEAIACGMTQPGVLDQVSRVIQDDTVPILKRATLLYKVVRHLNYRLKDQRARSADGLPDSGASSDSGASPDSVASPDVALAQVAQKCVEISLAVIETPINPADKESSKILYIQALQALAEHGSSQQVYTMFKVLTKNPTPESYELLSTLVSNYVRRPLAAELDCSLLSSIVEDEKIVTSNNTDVRKVIDIIGTYFWERGKNPGKAELQEYIKGKPEIFVSVIEDNTEVDAYQAALALINDLNIPLLALIERLESNLQEIDPERFDFIAGNFSRDFRAALGKTLLRSVCFNPEFSITNIPVLIEKVAALADQFHLDSRILLILLKRIKDVSTE